LPSWEAKDSQDIKIDGGLKSDVRHFLSYFDSPVAVGTINLIVQ
jgi:hypothetical protein